MKYALSVICTGYDGEPDVTDGGNYIITMGIDSDHPKYKSWVVSEDTWGLAPVVYLIGTKEDIDDLSL